MTATSITAPDADGDSPAADKKAAVATEGIEKELKERERKDRWQRVVVPLLDKCGQLQPTSCDVEGLTDEEKKECLQTCTRESEKAVRSQFISAYSNCVVGAATAEDKPKKNPADYCDLSISESIISAKELAERRKTCKDECKEERAKKVASSSARRPEPGQSDVDREAARYQRQARQYCDCVTACGKTARCLQICGVPNNQTLRVAVVTGCH